MEHLYQSVQNISSNKILAIGKNYLQPQDVGPKEPIVFQKPLSSIYKTNPNEVQTLYLQRTGRELLHEVELGFMIGQACKNVPQDQAYQKIGGYFLALDLTDKYYFNYLKDNGLPWDLAKGQDGYCPLSNFIPVEKIKDPHNLVLEFKINGKTQQKDNTKNMYFKIDKLLSYTSSFMTLNPGDMFLTGTPAGVSVLNDGDLIEGLLYQGNELLTQIKLKIQLYDIKPKL